MHHENLQNSTPGTPTEWGHKTSREDTTTLEGGYCYELPIFVSLLFSFSLLSASNIPVPLSRDHCMHVLLLFIPYCLTPMYIDPPVLPGDSLVSTSCLQVGPHVFHFVVTCSIHLVSNPDCRALLCSRCTSAHLSLVSLLVSSIP